MPRRNHKAGNPRRKKQNTTKARCQQKHAKRRALERFGIDVTPKHLLEIGKMIRDGQSEPVLSLSNRCTRHRLTYNGVLMDVGYDNKRAQVVTFLYPDGPR